MKHTTIMDLNREEEVISTPENPPPSRRRGGVRRDPAGRVRQHSGAVMRLNRGLAD